MTTTKKSRGALTFGFQMTDADARWFKQAALDLVCAHPSGEQAGWEKLSEICGYADRWKAEKSVLRNGRPRYRHFLRLRGWAQGKDPVPTETETSASAEPPVNQTTTSASAASAISTLARAGTTQTVTLDLPPSMVRDIERIAKGEGLGFTPVAMALLAFAITQYGEGGDTT